jgi:hypothetical protein
MTQDNPRSVGPGSLGIAPTTAQAVGDSQSCASASLPPTNKVEPPRELAPSANSDDFSLLLATPTPTQINGRRLQKRAPIRSTGARANELGSSIPLKRRELEIEGGVSKKLYSPDRGISGLYTSKWAPPDSSFTMSIPPWGKIDIEEVLREVIKPLIHEIQELKAEIQDLKTQKAQGLQRAPEKTTIEPLKVLSTDVITVRTAIVVLNSQPLSTKKLTYAGVLRGGPGPQASTPPSAPWTLVTKKAKPQVQSLALKKATEPC